MTKKILSLIFALILLAGCTQTSENPYLVKGRNYLSSNNYSLALEQFKLAINDDPILTDAYTNAADILIAKGKYAEAKELLLPGSEYALVKANIFIKLAEVESRQLNFDAALSY